MLDPDVAALLRSLPPERPLSERTAEGARADFDAAPKPPPDPVPRVEDHVVPGPAGDVPVRLYAPAAGTGLPVVVYFHGGGWVLSSVDGHDALARRIAARTGMLLVSVDYRLAPEHPFPAAADDCWAVTNWLAAHADDWGGDPTRIAVCGDSAGGNLAASVALRARDAAIPLRLQALVYPCLDDRQDDYPSMEANAEGYLLSAREMAWFWDQYVPPEHRADPLAVPARADDLRGLAPALVMTAEYDPLRDEGERYADRLRDAGVPVETIRYPGMVHAFVSRWHLIAGAERAHDDLAAALRRAMG